MLTYTLKVEAIRHETIDTVTVCFKQPNLKKVRYLSGQYLTLIFRINGRRYLRPYSFSSASGIDPYIEVTVKRVPGGIVSNHINDMVQVGDLIEVLEPMGDFICDLKSTQMPVHVVLWGAGSGITPLISIAKDILNNYSIHFVTLVYGNRSNESAIFLDKINELQGRFSQRFSVWHFHTKLFVEQSNPNVVQGRINPKLVIDVMQQEGQLKNTVHYICGPTGLKQSIQQTLSQLSVPIADIHSEDFEIIRNPLDFENISTRFVKLRRDNVEHRIEVTKGKSILEAGLDSLLDLSYSCQTGSCNICKGKILDGEVKMIGTQIKSDSLMDNECLLCCSYPLTDNVEIIAVN